MRKILVRIYLWFLSLIKPNKMTERAIVYTMMLKDITKQIESIKTYIDKFNKFEETHWKNNNEVVAEKNLYIRFDEYVEHGIKFYVGLQHFLVKIDRLIPRVYPAVAEFSVKTFKIIAHPDLYGSQQLTTVDDAEMSGDIGIIQLNMLKDKPFIMERHEIGETYIRHLLNFLYSQKL